MMLEWASRRKKQLAILCRYHLPAIVSPLKYRFNPRFALDPTELRSQLAGELGLSNSDAAIDPYL
nr:hypothetical protein [Sinorhizobium fredii]